MRPAGGDLWVRHSQPQVADPDSDGNALLGMAVEHGRNYSHASRSIKVGPRKNCAVPVPDAIRECLHAGPEVLLDDSLGGDQFRGLLV